MSRAGKRSSFQYRTFPVAPPKKAAPQCYSGTEAELRAAIAVQKRKLLDLRDKRDKLDVLKRDVDTWLESKLVTLCKGLLSERILVLLEAKSRG